MLKQGLIVFYVVVNLLFSLNGFAQYRAKALDVSSLDDTATHFADGEGWTSEITLVNLDSAPAAFSISFYGNSGALVAVPFVNYGVQSTLNLSIPPLGSVTLKTAGTSYPLIEGWAQLTGAKAVAGSIVFRRSIQSLPDYESVVPFDSGFASRVAVPFDNTNGFFLGLALANTSSFSQASITLNFHDTNGTSVFLAVLTLGPMQHTSFVVPTKYPQVAGLKGVLEITSSNSYLSALALRFNSTGPFTTEFPVQNIFW